MWRAAVVVMVVEVAVAVTRPHIVLIVADDLGWNDVGFHGMSHIPTPNLDALAASGRPLQRYYVAPVCTPSRAALMTGKYPIHTGMQHSVIYGMEPRGLPLSEKILPQYLKELGYKTHLVGKWHLGHFKREYLPLNRGFDSHLGFWTGKIDMYDHTNMEHDTWGHDFRRGFSNAYDLFGRYVTDVYTDEAIKVIEAHNASCPLFLMVAHSAVHSGNPNQPIRAPDDTVDSFRNISDPRRQRFAGVLAKLDESVGRVTAALQRRGLLRRALVVFTTDNGGVPQGFNDNAGSNYPLRGTKNTLWEGGVRGAAFVWSPLIESRSRLAMQKMHIVDWLPTMLSFAGGNVSALADIDGVDQWAALAQDGPAARHSLLHNIDDDYGNAAITVDDWKLLNGTTYNGTWDGWYGPAGRERPYNVSLVYDSEAARAAAALGLMPAQEHYLEMRDAATLTCKSDLPPIKCQPSSAPCLFNIKEDPCELRNLADEETDPRAATNILSKKTLVQSKNGNL
ncbi:arylsulfatase I isoform X2 [Pectinophora gossypiella]|uniref:arylsulfatase I isoform X2 n=1 Tax=Pectinophora gossypiella TaxID=13191 RepID=UPI00214E864E|nr:arylsulfatase I isoform X2 [Pectinophora gossypiella]